MASVLTTKGLAKKYKKQMAVNGVDMNIEQGDIYGFVGENGSGKTTLMNGLLGIIKAKTGEIKFDENNMPYTEYTEDAQMPFSNK